MDNEPSRKFTMASRHFSHDGGGYIQDNNFDFDAGFQVSGDFYEGEKEKYAEMLVNALNHTSRGEGDKCEWLCTACNIVHLSQIEGLFHLCPDCGEMMLPTSYNLRKIEELQAQITMLRAELASAKQRTPRTTYLEPLVWRNTSAPNGLRRFMTQRQYDANPKCQKYYEPLQNEYADDKEGRLSWTKPPFKKEGWIILLTPVFKSKEYAENCCSPGSKVAHVEWEE